MNGSLRLAATMEGKGSNILGQGQKRLTDRPSIPYRHLGAQPAGLQPRENQTAGVQALPTQPPPRSQGRALPGLQDGQLGAWPTSAYSPCDCGAAWPTCPPNGPPR